MANFKSLISITRLKHKYRQTDEHIKFVSVVSATCQRFVITVYGTRNLYLVSLAEFETGPIWQA